jgi:hypothetical protein
VEDDVGSLYEERIGVMKRKRDTGPVWIHRLEIVLATLAPTSPKTSKLGGLDWVRFN